MRWAMLALAAALAAFVLVCAVIWLRATPAPMDRLKSPAVQILDRTGGRLGAFLAADGRWRFPTRPEDVDPLYLEILKAWEDKRFDAHSGVDGLALGRAVFQALTSGRVKSGASTLSMQTARLLDPAPRGLVAKLTEMKRARLLEQERGKAGVLEIYLTLAPFGGNLEGVKAASEAYFGKSPATLTPAEAALLAAIPKNPNAYRPDRDPAAARRARDRVLDRAEEAGVITKADADEARATDIPRERRAFDMIAPHAARRALLEGRAQGGEIRATIDPRLQAGAQDLARRAVERLDPMASAAVLIVHRPTLEIRAYVGASHPWSARRAGAIDMTRALRSPGSALKPFIYGLGFDRALLRPETILDDQPTDFGGYAPRNFDRGFSGQMSAAEALRRSLNVPAVQVLERLTPEAFDSALKSAGAPLAYDIGEGPSLALALGGAGISPYDMARLYAAFAGNGEVPSALRLTADAPAPSASPLMTPLAAARLRRILATAPRPESAPAEIAMLKASFKTGTSYGYRDAWAAGAAGDYALVVWLGRPDGAPCMRCGGFVAAAPLLLDLARLLPAPDPAFALDEPPEEDVGDLAPNLRRWGKGGGVALVRMEADPLEIVFPRDDTRILLPPGKAAPLRAEGGRPPVRWMANGRLLPDPAPGAPMMWLPDGPGHHKIEAIDSAGASVVSRVIVTESPTDGP